MGFGIRQTGFESSLLTLCVTLTLLPVFSSVEGRNNIYLISVLLGLSEGMHVDHGAECSTLEGLSKCF